MEKRSGMRNGNLNKIVRYFGFEDKQLCATFFKFYILFEYPEVTLEEEQARRGKKGFEEEELWRLARGAVNVRE